MATKEGARSRIKTLKGNKGQIKDVTSKQASRVKGGALSVSLNQAGMPQSPLLKR